MAIVKCRLEAWKPKIRIVRNTGELAGLLEPAPDYPFIVTRCLAQLLFLDVL